MDEQTRTTLRLDEQLCFALYAATNAITRAYRPLLEQIGLTYPQYLAMMVLWEDDDLPVGEIAACLHLPPHAVTPVVRRLETQGLVTRRRDPRDHRVVRVGLTAAGSELEYAAAQIRSDVVCATRLGPAPSDVLREQLHALAARLEEPLLDVGADLGSGADPGAVGPADAAHEPRSAC